MFPKSLETLSTLSAFKIKTFNSKDPRFFINLFKLYVSPILEHNVSAWMPYQVSGIKKIESVQATFTKLVFKKFTIKYDSYKYCLSFFNLDTLEIRQIKYNLILIFKIFHNLIDLQLDDFFSISRTLKLYQLRRHKLHLNKHVSLATLI